MSHIKLDEALTRLARQQAQELDLPLRRRVRTASLKNMDEHNVIVRGGERTILVRRDVDTPKLMRLVKRGVQYAAEVDYV